MARVVVGRLTFQVRNRTAQTLKAYESRALGGVPAVMALSEERVFAEIEARTPVKTGYMQRALRRTSEFVPVETGYAVFWRAADFPPDGFYPVEVVLGGPNDPGEDMMSPALERERTRLTRDLSEHFRRAGR